MPGRLELLCLSFHGGVKTNISQSIAEVNHGHGIIVLKALLYADPQVNEACEGY
jgi:hypothetical protein